ncbi:MAG: ribosome biogenesis GTPase Der [Cyclobacteriaceae bacterium]|nr:ribosome biogenesis GTPase Der [Cyclobacteriaceae bacterium]
MGNVVAIVGRPNVGKSTLFNRLIEQRKAIMDDTSGVTRDRHYGIAEWTGKRFTVIDTGGYVRGSSDKFESEIRKQVEISIQEASVLLFVVDCQTGITGLDEEFMQVVRTSKKPVIIVANKADNPELRIAASEFYQLGFEEIFPICSSDGSGTGELLDKVVSLFEDDGDPVQDDIPKIAILGRPNVGKSSFLNALLGKDRSIVTNEAGTTRDAIDSHYKLFGKDFKLIDTAGIRKKAKIKDDLEFYSVLRSIKTLQDADVCIVILDAQNGLESQDMNIISLANRYNKGILIMVNKWDLIEKDSKTADTMMKEYKEKLGDMNYIPIIFTSVLTKQRIFQAIEKAMEVYENFSKKISTSKLNDILLPEIERYPPPAIRGNYIKIKYITQLPTQVPSFAFFCNHPQHIKAPYLRFLENKLRNNFGFEGVPIRIFARKK